MAYNKKKKDYNVEYTKKHYTRVSLLVKNDMYVEHLARYFTSLVRL